MGIGEVDMGDIADMVDMVDMEVAEGLRNLVDIKAIRVIEVMEALKEVEVQNHDSLGPGDLLAINLGESKSINDIQQDF